MSNLIPFDFESYAIRVTNHGGDPWFVLADVCRVLEHSNPSMAAKGLDDDEKDTLNIAEGTQSGPGNPNVTIINESGLYSLILTSRKPAAKRFKKWVTAEVLPSIRKTGVFAVRQDARPAFPDTEAIRRIDGISRMLSHKAAETEKAVKLIAELVERQDQRIGHLETAVIALAQATKNLMLTADARGIATTEFISVRRVLDDAGALPKARNGLNRKIGNALRTLALTAAPPVPVRKCLHSGVWLFPVDFVATFMRESGNALVADHNAAVAGQGVLKFPSRHRRPGQFGNGCRRPGA